MISLSTLLLTLVTYTNSYRVLKYSKYRCPTSLKNANSSSLPTVDLSSKYLLDYLQEAKPFTDYNVMENFRAAEFSGIDNKILTFPKMSYPAEDMGYEFATVSNPRIFVRECYKEMYDLIMKMNNIEDIDERRRRFLVTGTPGIGKSLFALYFIKRYLDENNYSAPFGFQRKREKADIITSNGAIYKGVPSEIYGSEKHLPFFCDGIEKFEPSGPSVPSLMIVTSSPDDARFKEYAEKKNFVVKLTMPVWSREELSEMYDAFEMEAMHDREIDIEYQGIVIEQTLYDIYGGVPRSIQSQDGKKMIKALLKKGSAVAFNFFKAGNTPGTGPDIENSYTLVHLVPPHINEDGDCDYFDNIAMVASRYAFNILQNTSDAEISRLMKKVLLLGDPGGRDAVQGFTFEAVFYREVPAEMNLYALNKKGSSTVKIISNVTKSIGLPKEKYWPRNSKDFKNWTSNVLYVPTSKTLESSDAFFIQGTKEQSQLYILQLTVAKTHKVKANGLLKIVKHFEDSGYKIDSESMKLHLVFVTPKKENFLPGKQMTNYQTISRNERGKNVTSILVSKSEDDRIIEVFENQAQYLFYYIITNE